MSDPYESSDDAAGYESRPEPHLAVKIHRLKYLSRRYWWIVAVTIMIGLGIQDVLCLRQVPSYVSTSRMMVNGRISLPEGQLYSDGLALANFYGTQVALMRSPQMVSQAFERVTTIHPEATVDEEAIVDASLEVKTSIFDIKVTSKDPDFAKLLVDALMDTYLSSQRGWKNQTTDDAVSAITEKISGMDADIRTDEQQLLDFQKDNNVGFIEEESSGAATYLVSLNRELSRLTKERDLLVLESKDPLVNTSDDDGIGQPSKTEDSDPTIQSALPGNDVNTTSNAILAEQNNIEKLKILKDQFSVDLKDEHPKMKELSDSIAKEEKFLEVLKTRSQMARDARREGLNLQMKNVEQQIATWDAKSLELSQRLGTYQKLRSKLNREQELYNQMASNIPSLSLNKSLDEDVVILEAASKATPLPTHNLIRLVGAFVGGLIVGLAIVYAIVSLDDKIESPMQFTETFEFPLVGQIPLTRLDKETKRVPLLAYDDGRHSFLEHHRDIRSAILFGPSDAVRLRSIMVASAAPGEGKSTLATNLATVFAYSGSRVLLIDADLRKGVLHTIFNQPVGPGLSNYLQGEISWREAVQSTKIPKLDLLPRGKVSRHAGDLLPGPITDLLVQETLDEYDLVLWDTAPLYAADDAANLCSKVDSVLFVARVRHSSVGIVQRALEDLTLRKANILGVVLNAVAPGQPGYFEKYLYKEYGPIVAEV